MLVSKSGLPRMGLGMAALGRPGYITLDRSAVFGGDDRSIDKMQQASNNVIETLFSLTEKPWLDCARSYGLSEKFVGEYLRGNKIDPKSVYVSSKWGYTYVADWQVSLEEGAKHEVKDHSTENFLKQVEETASFLGEFLDLYQIHSATFDSGILTDSRAHKALSYCRKEKGWAIGLSVSGPDQDEILREAMAIKVDGESLFDSVQCTFNVLEQKPGKALKEAADAGMDIIIKEGMANGRAFGNEKLAEHAKKLSCEVDQLALAFSLAQDFQPRVLSGAVTSQQLSSNWKALDVVDLFHKQPSLLDDIAKDCVVPSEDYWNERSALSWN
eukprot:scaffold1129_cov164-Amphora_coffeaeformis.AAC.4